MVEVCFCVDYGQKYTFTGGWDGWEEKWGLKLTSATVEVEAELGNYRHISVFSFIFVSCSLTIGELGRNFFPL